QRTRGRPLLDVVDAALAGGVDAIQLREKDLSGAALLELAGRLREVTHRYGARLLINDRIDIALACEADGVHLPADSFASTDARRLLGNNRLLGVSTHSVQQARAAAAGGADFIVFGPVFETPSKRAFGTPVGLDALAQAAQAVTLPVLAIGGLSVERVASVLQRGARGVAVVAALLEADDPRAAAAALRAFLR
ncbi:MAG TPA: thiamine phosphate synthase, partial [Burkholderiaceae bacterium]|nr:thiamine phosphate synthase [Burkholderiaceae bacterium]